jgi:ketosteroid isomerase-like protein
MKTLSTDTYVCKILRPALFLALGMTLLFLSVSPAAAQKKKKKDEPVADPSDTAKVVAAMPDERQIDYTISEMLGAWQIGDIEKLHKDYADDVIVVSGAYAPPTIGWANYLALYQQQKPRMQQVRMDRLNTYVKVAGNFGWACYQWDFAATVDGQPTTAQGQTTLILEKRNNQWVIVHNHTSMVPTTQPSAPANTPAASQPQPNKP